MIYWLLSVSSLVVLRLVFYPLQLLLIGNTSEVVGSQHSVEYYIGLQEENNIYGQNFGEKEMMEGRPQEIISKTNEIISVLKKITRT
jgi:hypothetical protein